MPTDVKKIKRDRYLFLHLLYEQSNGSEQIWFDMWEVGNELELDQTETQDIVQYLQGEYLIEARGMGGSIGLTHAGIKEVEQALENPDQPTEHFLPINIINIQSMQNSTLQQGTNNSTVNFQIDQTGMNGIDAIISKLGEIKDALSLTSEQRAELTSEIQTIQSQRSSPKPKSIIIRESLKTIRTLMECVTGNAITPAIIHMITNIIG